MRTVDGFDVDKGVSGKMNKKDKRSRKTVSAIQSTLLELLCTKRVQEIKIVDLCTAADINRTTFYLHFSGIPDVLEELRSEITERIFENIDEIADFNKPKNPMPFLNVCTDVLESYPHFTDFVRMSQDADIFLSKLKKQFSQSICKHYLDTCGSCMENAVYVFRFLTSGVLDTYTEWLQSDRSVSFDTILSQCAPIVAAGQEILAKNTTECM